MKVFKVALDSDHYQSLVFDGDENQSPSPWQEGGALLFDGRLKEDWICPPMRAYDTSIPVGDFFHVGPGCFGIHQSALEKTRTELELAGQLLPIKAGKIEGAILNITTVVNCLDHDRSEWVYGRSTGLPIRCKKYVFRVDHLPESTLFKIPEQVRGTVFVHTGHGEPEDSFLERVEQYALKGLELELVFSDEK